MKVKSVFQLTLSCMMVATISGQIELIEQQAAAINALEARVAALENVAEEFQVLQNQVATLSNGGM